MPERQEEVSHASAPSVLLRRRTKSILSIGFIADNAGHTIVANGITYDFHLLPSGLINPECSNLIGSGVVVHVPAFFKELHDLKAKGLEDAEKRVFISDRAHVVFDLHQLVDGLEEVELAKGGEKKAIGTTRKGIGPAYSTKATRSGVRISEIFNEELFNAKLRELARGYKERYGDLLKYDVEEEISRFNVGRYIPTIVEETTNSNLLGIPRKSRRLRCRCGHTHQHCSEIPNSHSHRRCKCTDARH